MHHFHVLTGAPGSGKTAVLEKLRGLGFAVVDEPARQILAEQRSFGGRGVPDTDPGHFTDLLLSRALRDYRRACEGRHPVFFDRGIPDVIAYAAYYGLDTAPARNASGLHRYNSLVFVTPHWEEIYQQDDERRMTFDEACRFGDDICEVYRRLGYELLELPRDTPDSRAEFIRSRVNGESSSERRTKIP